MLNPPEEWYCCLHPIEAEMTFLLAGSALPIFPFVQEDIYRVLWSASGGTLDDARYEVYAGMYTLGLVELEIEGELLDFYQLDAANLLQWQIFFSEGGRACDDGCYMRPEYAIA